MVMASLKTLLDQFMHCRERAEGARRTGSPHQPVPRGSLCAWWLHHPPFFAQVFTHRLFSEGVVGNRRGRADWSVSVGRAATAVPGT